MLNDNSSYNNWKKLNYNLLIIGESCIHDKVISKEFGAGSIIISSGGMVASDPIFVKNLNNISEIEVIIKD